MDTQERIVMGTLKAAMMARKPAVLVGPPGTGKTAVVHSLAERMDYECLTIVGSWMDPSDVTGLPKGEHVMDDEDGNPIHGTVYLMPWWQIRIMQKKRVILFLDEFSNTPDSVRASWLTMLQNRTFPNGLKMPAETIVVAAMNPVDEAADGYQLDGPTTNRLMFIEWSPSVASWLKGMRSAWGNEAKTSEEEMKWRRKIASFIEDNPSRLDEKSRDLNTTEAYGVDPSNQSAMTVLTSAWSSRRSWNDVAVVLANADEDETIQDSILQGTIGFAGAVAFREWLIKNDVIDPKDVIRDPSIVDWKNVTLNDANIVLRAIVDLIEEDNVLEVLNVFETIANEDRARLGGPFVREVIKKCSNKSFANAARNKDAVIRLAGAYRSVAAKAARDS